MPTHKKFEWSMLAFLAPFVLAVIGWGISVEVRMSTSNALIDTKVAKMDNALNFSDRVKHIEDLMLPLLVDWKVNQEMKKILNPKADWGPPADPFVKVPAGVPAGSAPAGTDPSKKYTTLNQSKAEWYNKIEKEAENWAKLEITKLHEEESK